MVAAYHVICKRCGENMTVNRSRVCTPCLNSIACKFKELRASKNGKHKKKRR